VSSQVTGNPVAGETDIGAPYGLYRAGILMRPDPAPPGVEVDPVTGRVRVPASVSEAMTFADAAGPLHPLECIRYVRARAVIACALGQRVLTLYRKNTATSTNTHGSTNTNRG
jgi:hypothetical protein